MLKNKLWLGIFLSIILLVFSMNGFTAYYKYTQESGADFYVGTGDKADALEDTNEMRQIIDDLGALLVHSKRNDLYPKDGTTGGTIQIPEAGLNFSNAPENNDIAAYIAGEMAWQTKAELGIDLSLYYLKTEIDTLSEVETIWGVTLCTDSELTTALADYYLKTAVDTIGEVEAIWVKNITDSTELATALTDYYLKTAIDSQGEVESIWGVSLANDSELHTILTLGTASGLSLDGQELSLAVADTDTTGALSDTDWDTFNNKLSNITGESIGDLGDVDLTDIANLKILKYNSTSGNWECEDDAGGGVDTSGTPEANDIARFTDVDTIEGINYTELKTALALSSDDLSDVASIGMLDENEYVTGFWNFNYRHNVSVASDTNSPYIAFLRERDGDPTRSVSDGDIMGRFDFRAYSDDYYDGAAIRAIVDATPGTGIAGRLEFLTTPDGTYTPLLRMAIDNAGNIKMGDGAWTNYINVSAGGVMTAEGTASIKATDLVIASQVAGDILYFNGTNWIRLAIGTAGQILTVNAGGTAPEWQTP